MTLEIISFDIADKALLDEFIELPFKIYPGRYNWVAQPRSELQHQLSLENPFFTHGKARAFLCRQDRKTVGRILASIDHSLVQSAGSGPIGHFGYFECQNDPEVALALFANAESWLVAQGMRTVHGPIQLNILTSYRIQTKGFETAPFLGEPRNPPYYEALLTAAGYHRGAGWRSWDLTQEHSAVMLISTGKKLQESDGLTIKEVDFAKSPKELDAFYPLAKSTYADNLGFSQISLQEIAWCLAPLLALLGPGCFYKIMNAEGVMIGYVFGYPDMAEAVNAAVLSQLSLPQALARHPPKRFLYFGIGLLKEYRKTTAAYRLMNSLLDSAVKNYSTAVGCLAKEGPAIYEFSGEASRCYHVFEKSLAKDGGA